MAYLIKDTRVFLTGASDGIGAALAEALGAEGARVALFARRRDKLADVAERVRAAGGEALELPGDVTVQGDLKVAVDTVLERWGGVDLVIANAGIGDGSFVNKLDADRLAHVIDVNVVGAMRTVSATMPVLLEQGSGHVVGVASPAGFRGLPRGVAYSASKAALTSFLESLRGPARARGVLVTTVHPGFVRTPLTDQNDFDMPFLLEPDQAAAHILRAIKRRRREYTFPWQMAAIGRLIRFIPNAAFDAISRKL